MSSARLTWVFGLVALLAGADLVYDLRTGSSAIHIVLESAIVLAVGLGGFVPMVRRLRSFVHHAQALKGRADGLKQRAERLEQKAEGLEQRAEGLEQRAEDLELRAEHLEQKAGDLRQRAEDLEQQLAASRSEADVWRREAGALIAGLSAAIDRQLDHWALSPAEKEVALLLLKGLSHKEIAEIRAVSETTVRQQARALYRKAGLTGRHDLAAFFLEELLEPKRQSPAPKARDSTATAERSAGDG